MISKFIILTIVVYFYVIFVYYFVLKASRSFWSMIRNFILATQR